jgi:hypothetical protein
MYIKARIFPIRHRISDKNRLVIIGVMHCTGPWVGLVCAGRGEVIGVRSRGISPSLVNPTFSAPFPVACEDARSKLSLGSQAPDSELRLSVPTTIADAVARETFTPIIP